MFHVPRVIASVARGLWEGRSAAKKLGAPSMARAGLDGVPHVYRGRAGLLDIDTNLHLNNAAYLVHCELARWQLVGANGMLKYAWDTKCLFLVGATALRFRRSVRPFAAFEVRTRVQAWDERAMIMQHDFHYPGSDEILATALCRAVLKRGRTTVSAQEVITALGVEGLPVAHGMDAPTVRTLLALDDTLRDAQRPDGLGGGGGGAGGRTQRQ